MRAPALLTSVLIFAACDDIPTATPTAAPASAREAANHGAHLRPAGLTFVNSSVKPGARVILRDSDALLREGDGVTLEWFFRIQPALEVRGQGRIGSFALPGNLRPGLYNVYVGAGGHGRDAGLLSVVGPAWDVASIEPASGPAGTIVTITDPEGRMGPDTRIVITGTYGLVQFGEGRAATISEDGTRLITVAPDYSPDEYIFVVFNRNAEMLFAQQYFTITR